MKPQDSNYLSLKRKRYALKQEKIRILGNLKKVQNDLIANLNECATAEVCHYNALKKGVIMAKFKATINRYFKIYGDMIINDDSVTAIDLELKREYGVVID